MDAQLCAVPLWRDLGEGGSFGAGHHRLCCRAVPRPSRAPFPVLAFSGPGWLRLGGFPLHCGWRVSDFVLCPVICTTNLFLSGCILTVLSLEIMGSELQLSCCSHRVSVNAWTRGWGNTVKDKDLEGKLSCQLSQGSALLPLSFTVSPP